MLFRSESSNYTRVDDSTFVFDGKTLLNDFSKTFSLPDDYFIEPEGEFETLAGLILEIEGRLPEKHEVIFFRDFEFRIDAVDSRRIKKIRVIRRTAEEDI